MFCIVVNHLHKQRIKFSCPGVNKFLNKKKIKCTCSVNFRTAIFSRYIEANQTIGIIIIIIIIITLSPLFRSHYGPGVESASNINEYQEYFPGVKAAGA